jgi:hypothetical protein
MVSFLVVFYKLRSSTTHWFSCSGGGNDDQGVTKTYWLSTHYEASWIEAKMICNNFGLEFLKLDTEQEQNFALNLFQQHKGQFNEHTHVGGITNVKNNKYNWNWVESGSKINYMLRFGDGEPKNYGGDERCLSVMLENDNFVFHDMSCSIIKHKFLCQN